jgi:predicted N-formylglutamate amidohydrolase
MTEAFHLIPETGNRGVFIFGDHASRHIPTRYNNLGLSGEDLTRHIAWDIGTETVIRRLCKYFKCAGQLAGVSRLLIDMNRDPEAAGLIPEDSDGTVVPGNQNLSATERRDRVDNVYTPYHAALAGAVDALDAPFVLSVHSFTPHPRTGEHRATDIGLLTRHDEDSAAAFRNNFIESGAEFQVDINLPYSAYDLNYTVDAHIAPRGLRHLAIEIRQDHISTETKALVMADILAEHIAQIIVQSQSDTKE